MKMSYLNTIFCIQKYWFVRFENSIMLYLSETAISFSEMVHLTLD